MGMPSVTISFKEIAATAVKRGERGIIAMILRDSTATGTAVSMNSVDDIPSGLSSDNKQQIKNAFLGYINPPKKVIAYILTSSAAYTDALAYFALNKFDYLVIPTVETDEKTTDIVTWIKAQRETGKMVKAVLPNTTADCEAIINFTTTSVNVGETTYTAEKFCSRIAGIIAGTPLYMSCTYAPISEATDCTKDTKANNSTAIDAGKLIVWWDGEKVKIARGVTSLTTTTSEKGDSFKKIKIVDALDMIKEDITRTIEDSYIGKYANSYANRLLLIAAINAYFESLEKDNVLSSYNVKFDIDAIRTYLSGKGIDTSDMSDSEIEQAETGSNVFITANVKPLDAIEDVTIPIFM